MKKIELYNIGKSDYKISDFLISKIISKRLNLGVKDLFLLDEITNYKEIILDFEKLKKNYPIEYILSSAEFYSLDFYVDNRVLIPRNDTEIMVEMILKTLNNHKIFSMIDVGTGSSCIPISVLKNSNNIKNCYVVDLSKEALEVSNINVKKHNLTDKIESFNSDLLTKLKEKKINLEKNLIISANLPYIKDGDFENMDQEVILYEPKMALYGGKNTGFELYEKLLDQLFELKNKYNLENIYAFFEIGFDQYEYSKQYLSQKGLKFEYFKDMNNIYRVIKINI